MTDKIKLGKEGERLAANFLMQKGFEVIYRNYRFRRAEIDLIVKQNDWLIFVEVKTRSSSSFGEPEEAVTVKKIRMIYDAAEEYIYAIDWKGHIRFDIISVKLGNPPEIIHFEDAIN
ncbi:MAG TPA: YraN family protein [Cyclobacteriaceae bacterium]|nr:YraN family protein [Cyclobacteriaceae bacterium]